MQTRIRYFRKMRGLTLRDLAGRVGTTPQTVQRLETANMTVSTDWLERLAKALDVRLVDLLDDTNQMSIERLGVTGRGDRIEPITDGGQFILDVPADDPVAIEISNATGSYQKGMTLIGSRYDEANIVNALGRDAIICLLDGGLLLRKLLLLPGDAGYALVPLETKGESLFVAKVKWAAPVIMTVSYI